MSLQKYQEHIQDASLDAVVDLLQHTSELVSLFNDRLYIGSTEDCRLYKLNEFHQWISQWAKALENKKKISFSLPNFILIWNLCASAFSPWFTISYLKCKMQ